MNVKEIAQASADYIIDRRRYYHAHPELSFAEWETTKSISEDCCKLGLSVEMFPDHPGLVASIDTGKPGKTILLRSDIDGLPVQEQTGLPFSSQNPGIMHVCGHDNHIAMQLGAAKILMNVKDSIPCGKIKFLFQSGEETGYGAKYYIDHGVLNDVDAVLGMHIWGGLDSPFICVDPGLRMASMDTFSIYVHGVQAHGASPQDGRDAILASGAILTVLQTLVSRRNNPLNPLVVTVGQIKGGVTFNTVSPYAEMHGSIRTFSEKFRRNLAEELQQLIDTTAAAYGCSAEFVLNPMLPAVINSDETLNNIANKAAEKLYGREGISKLDTLMASEDFAMYTEHVPGFFAFIGSRNLETGNIYTNHNEKYTSDENALHRGSAFAAQFAIDYLSEELK